MKIRFGFVSNSSSSSFTLAKSKMTKKQINAVVNHIGFWKNIKDKKVKNLIYSWPSDCLPPDQWDIVDGDDTLVVSTNMDNFNMYSFFKYIKLGMDAIVAEDRG